MSIVYLTSDYFATGEGSRRMFLVTRLYPKQGESLEAAALRAFAAAFDGYMARGMRMLSRDEFFEKYGHYAPSFLHKLTDPDAEEPPGGLMWQSELYLNFS